MFVISGSIIHCIRILINKINLKLSNCLYVVHDTYNRSHNNTLDNVMMKLCLQTLSGCTKSQGIPQYTMDDTYLILNYDIGHIM